jgi:hypothetical protein
LILASSANKRFEKELCLYNINKDIKNGQTVYGLVGFRDIGYDPLSLKLKVNM